jgi:hypothetical protein
VELGMGVASLSGGDIFLITPLFKIENVKTKKLPFNS